LKSVKKGKLIDLFNMAASFDPYDKSSWYFGTMSRQDATDLLMTEKESGVFLVRDSSTILGDFVLCVREENKVSHYIVNKIQGDQTRFRIGDQVFPDIPGLLNFYKLHYLDTTPLVRPAPRKVEKVIAKYDFNGSDPDDLPFRKGEVLTNESKDEDQWWTARNSLGQTGSIPVPYVQKYDEPVIGDSPRVPASHITSPPPPIDSVKSRPVNDTIRAPMQPVQQRTLPALAVVKQARVPNAYDKTALKLEVGDIVTVTKTNINGQWEGELKGKVGHFPFTHIDFIDDNTNRLDES